MTSESDRPEAELWGVEAVEDGVAILVLADGTHDVVVIEVAAELLGDRAQPGLLLRVPLGAVGEPVWDGAEPVPEDDEAAEEG